MPLDVSMMLPGFEIAMDDAGAMRGGERVGDVNRVGQRVGERQLAAPRRAASVSPSRNSITRKSTPS